MAERDFKVSVTGTTAWWLPLYLKALCFVAVCMNREPDWDKLQLVVARGLRVKLGPPRQRETLE